MVDITSYGANCNGTVDNGPAIANAVVAARSQGLPVYIPTGTCAYRGVIRLDSVKLIGGGDTSVLYALDWSQESIFLYGTGPEVRSVKLSGVKSTTRQAAWEATRITIFGATGFVIDNVTIDGSAAAGIQTAQAANHGTISNNRLSDTLADSIHMTDRANYITVTGNVIQGAGDDGIAVVSYKSDTGMVNHITATNNIVRNNKYGRLMSVVGGSTVLYQNNLLDTNLSPYACLYIAQEAGWNTYGAHDVTASDNTMKTCGSLVTGHGAIMVFSEGGDTNTNIVLKNNDIWQSSPDGVRVFSTFNLGVAVDSNRVSGALMPLDISSPGVTVTLYTTGTVGEIGL